MGRYRGAFWWVVGVVVGGGLGGGRVVGGLMLKWKVES